ncbi:DNA mismatch repair endonuclease MutL [Candidatus Igneacidithiobacillus taiwanensis]|uniref:DNA mismatch repair endonuclease MutL n=1 Tax=Candidatus Igneacidithiobacillus taiwanensis TaxID=1945924 RepID=UPI00289CFBCB|nr:DNA mismatch repair endonuclease MutL [Candidatus Igneacidithiobacillus taiwanensis]
MAEMRRVQVMSPQLADRIAAGEVVERPASVLKELVENSLDAGARQVDVRLEGAGIELLEVQDDGSGIPAEDLPLALSRHATSKLYDDQELAQIHSFGFRGEALPAIASVARLEISSRATGANAARRLRLDAGIIVEDTPAARAQGTTVRVEDLFYNVPARRKFLKAPSTELQRIQKLWRQFALAAFPVDLRLAQGKRQLAHYPAARTELDQDARVAAVMGDDFLRNALRFAQEHGELRLWGWLGLPSFNRPRADEQYFFVNGRAIQDAGLRHALRSAYADVLFQDRQPVAICYLELPPERVDVNVHPAKTEVRFQDARQIHDFVRHSLAEIIAAQARPRSAAVAPAEAVLQERPQSQLPLNAFAPTPVRENAADYWEKLVAPVFAAPERAAPTRQEDAEPWQAYPLGRALGQIHHRFIVAENAEGMLLVDQHAAHERILYERFKSQRAAGQRQHLLLPLTLSLTPAQAERLEERAALLQEAGLDWSRAGPTSVRIHACAPGFPQAAIADLVADCLAEEPAWQAGQGDERLAEMACHAAIKDHHALSLAEMNALLRQLETTPRYTQCNHGRPTVVQWNLAELDRLFLRGR